MIVLKKVGSLMNGMLPFAFALGLALVMGDVVMAQDPELIPDLNVPVESYITEGITKMGAVVGVAVGGFFVFLIIRKALRWAGRAL